jgi:type IV secretion system protein VirD4
VNNWQLKPSVAVALVVGLVGLWLYLAGGIFMVAYDHEFTDANPFTVFQYWAHYGQAKSVQNWLFLSLGISLLVVFGPVAAFLRPKKRSLFGDAAFATTREIQKAGLLGDAGIILGKFGRKYLMFGGSQHVLLSAATRSGKGVGIVIPNLLNWAASVVCLDMKLENWQLTSLFRKLILRQECYLFNPLSKEYKTHRYNPLSYVSEDPNFRIDDIQQIANMLFPDTPGTDIIWTATPRSLFLGIVLYLCETPNIPRTFGQVLREVANADGSSHLRTTINERAASKTPLSGTCIRALNSYVSIESDNTRSGIIGGFRARLELWSNPLVDAATSDNDFDLRDVRKRRMSIYLGVTPNNLVRAAPLLNLFFQQLLDLNTRELPSQNKSLKYQCLLLMDEFTAMGKIQIMSKGVGYIAGYGLRLMPIIQSPAQLAESYGKDAQQTFITNHAVNIVFPPKASETQTNRDISEWLGYYTTEGKSVSKGNHIFTKQRESQSLSDQRRALLLPQEVANLGQTKELIFMENTAPIQASKIRFYSDTVFMDRLKSVSASLHALGRKFPSQDQLDAISAAGELSAAVPRIDMHAFEQSLVNGFTISVSVNTGETMTVTRAVVASDIPHLAKLTLASFALDFSGTTAPHTGDLDETALNAYADRLCRQSGMNV